MELTKSQKQIIEQRNKNILVSASAGSGKTFVVIERILNRILKDKISVDKMLVVTFTNAAASELKERLTKKLYSKLEEIKEKEERKYILNQIRRIPLSNISTIHSFCLNVIKDNFFNLGIDPSISIMEDSMSKIYILESIMETIEECYEKKEETFIDVLQLFKSENNLIEVIQNVYRYYLSIPDREEWINKVKDVYKIQSEEGLDLSKLDFGNTIISSLLEKVEVLELELDRVLYSIEDLEDFRTRYDILLGIKNKIHKIKTFKTYDEIYEYIDILDVSERLPSSKVSSEELKESVKQVKTLSSKYLKDMKNIAYKNTKDMLLELNSVYYIVEYITDMLIDIDEKYTAKKKEKNVIDFTDIEHIALKALQNEEIAKIYKEKFEEIYIDEYQDTSRVQETIISKIKRENNLIMVGDVKQSIYGFRHAVPELFTEKYLAFPQDELEDSYDLKILLDRNFRSEHIVLDTANYIFKKAMTLKCGGIDYNEDESLKYGKEPECFGEEYLTEVNVVETEYEEINEEDETESFIEEMTNLEKESKFVAERINEIISSKMQVIDDVTKEKRDIKYKDIVILLRSISKAGSIIEEVLKKNNVPVFSDSGEGFLKTEEINLIISFVKILNNEFDDISLASIMYSIIGNFTLDEITEIRIENKNTHLINSLRKYVEQGENILLKEKTQMFLNLIEKYRSYLDIYSFAETIIKLYDETGIYNAMELEENSKMKKANLDAFIEIVSNFEKKEGKSLISLLSYIENLNKKGGSYDSPKIMGENEDVVRIMTIHKSKGLEFPVVILMNTNKKYNDIDEKQDVLTDEGLGLGLNIYNKEYNIVYPSVIKQAIKQKKRDSIVSEELRLLYVALTRAKYKLLIYGSVPNYEKFESKLCVNNENNNLSLVDVKSSNSYLKLIIKVCNSYINTQSPICIKVLKFMVDNNKEEKQNQNNFTIRNCSYFEKLTKEMTGIDIDERYLQELKNKYEQKYKYEKAGDIQQKYTATELKEQGTRDASILLQDLRPAVLEKEVSRTSYGTFIHKIVENIDLRNVTEDNIQNSISLAIEQMKLQGKVDVSRIKKKILKMLSGSLKDILENSREIYKEYEFVIRDNLKGIDELEKQEETLIQGIIDLYIVTKDGKHIIIDYKTDKVGNKEELIDKYKYQLLVYKRAIEVLKEVVVDNMYIYSFYLDELIRL